MKIAMVDVLEILVPTVMIFQEQVIPVPQEKMIQANGCVSKFKLPNPSVSLKKKTCLLKDLFWRDFWRFFRENRPKKNEKDMTPNQDVVRGLQIVAF